MSRPSKVMALVPAYESAEFIQTTLDSRALAEELLGEIVDFGESHD
jgi:hypothetical protein